LVQRYLDSIPVTSQNDAKVLGSSSGWEILEELREAGIDGLTVNEIADRLDLPSSTVYNILRQLSAAGFLKTKRYKKKIGAPDKKRRDDELRTGKKKRIYLEAIPWGWTSFEDEFRLFIEKRVNEIIDQSEIGQQCSDLIERILEKMKKDRDGKAMFPAKNVCPNCNMDHEARELLWALLLAISTRVLNSQELEEKCKQHDLVI